MVLSLGCELDQYGTYCQQCTNNDNCQICDVNDGGCYVCEDEYIGASCNISTTFFFV
jgi:hypothetical protein